MNINRGRVPSFRPQQNNVYSLSPIDDNRTARQADFTYAGGSRSLAWNPLESNCDELYTLIRYCVRMNHPETLPPLPRNFDFILIDLATGSTVLPSPQLPSGNYLINLVQEVSSGEPFNVHPVFFLSTITNKQIKTIIKIKNP